MVTPERGMFASMRCTVWLWALAVVLSSACDAARHERGDEDEAPPAKTAPSASASEPANMTPNTFYAGGTPTFIVGTSGDEPASRGIALQVELIRGMLFPQAKVVTDSSVDVSGGAAAWPKNPVVYGGAHVSSIVRALSLPVVIEEDRIRLGSETFEGEGLRFIGVIPARSGGSGEIGHPAFMLYAGTGPLGTAEINAVTHGTSPWLIADAFGVLATGRWTHEGGKVVPRFDERRGHRIRWRDVTRELAGSAAKSAVTFRFPEKLDPAPDEAALIDAGMRGLRRAVDKLEIAAPTAMQFYVYPDPRSKKSITGDMGNGHAVASSRSLHVIRADAGDGFEQLVAHEGTHVLTAYAWGPAATPLIGEGVAVWVSGYYAGTSLTEWKSKLGPRHTVERLLGDFRKLPENETYPLAGLLVAAAVESAGLAGVREHLYPALPSAWTDACLKAGTTAEALERSVLP